MRENIVYADASMIPALTELWMEAFGDEREYVEFYFSHRFTEENMMVYLMDHHPVSMISLLPAYLHKKGARQKARYVYAVATKEEYRGRGYARDLILTAKKRLGEPLVLEPAEDWLMEYYRKMGFREAFYVREYDLLESRNVIQAAELELPAREKKQQYWLLTITPSEYAALRNRKFAGSGYVEWEEEAICYALLENELEGGYAYKVFHDGREDLLLYRIENTDMQILETTLADEDIFGVLEKLRLSPDAVWVRRPADHGGKRRVLGMLLDNGLVEDGYLNLTLE